MPRPIVDRLAEALAAAHFKGQRMMSFQLSDVDMIELRRSRDARVVLDEDGATFDGVACVLAVHGGQTRGITDQGRAPGVSR